MSDQRETTAKCCRLGQGADTAYGSSLRRLARALSLPLEAGTLARWSARIALAHNNGGPTAVLAVAILEGPAANGE